MQSDSHEKTGVVSDWTSVRSDIKVICCALPVLCLVGYLLLCWLSSLIFTNDRDNHDPKKQAEMVSIALKVGDLAPIPSTAVKNRVWTEGNDFSREFHVVFSASRGTLRKWLSDSPGISKATKEVVDKKIRYILEPTGGWIGADVLVDPVAGTAHIHVVWS